MSGPEDTLLAEDLREIAPRPDPAFRARMDARLAQGFPAPPRRRIALRPRLLVPALGTVAAAVVAVVLVLGGSSSDAPRPEIAREGQADSAADAGAGSAPAPQAAAPAPLEGRRVERSTRLELGASAGRFTAVTDGVVRTTQRHEGFVSSSQIGRQDGAGSAIFVLRIPTARLDAAVAELSGLGTVRAIEQATQDLTGTYDATSARLDDARTQRRAIVAALATARGEEADRLRARLADATARVARLERRQRELRARTSYATVDLTVVGARDDGAGAGGDDGAWTPGDAWRDARRGLEVAAGILIVVASFGVPLALLALLAGWVRRRRRDTVLDRA